MGLGCTIEFPADLVEHVREFCRRTKWRTMQIAHARQVPGSQHRYIFTTDEITSLKSCMIPPTTYYDYYDTRRR